MRVGDYLEPMLYINGEWREAASGKTFEVPNPATGKVLDRVADADVSDAEEAIAAARAAFAPGRRSPPTSGPRSCPPPTS